MFDGPFRGSRAVADGLLTPDHLRGPRFRRLFPDIYLQVGRTAPDLHCLSRAAYLYVEGFGVLGGYSAAALMKIDCAPRGAVPEVIVERDVRCRTGLAATRAHVPEVERRLAGGCLVTSPLLTAWHLTRRLDLVDAVIALDALARYRSPIDEPFAPTELLDMREKRPGARGCRRLDQVVPLADARAGSPMETRLRLLLVFAGLRPEVQYTVRDRLGRMHFDLAFPEAKLAIEYDGRGHLELGYGDRRRDLRSGALGWHTMRFDAGGVLDTPDETVHLIRSQRERRLRSSAT